MMIVPAGVKVHLALGYTNMRKGMDGLAMLVQDTLKKDAFSGHLFAYRGKRARIIKILFWDGNGLKAGAVPEDQLDPVRPLGPEHIDRARERIGRHGLAHQRCQSLGTLAEVDRLGRHHHPDGAGRTDHRLAFRA